MPMPIGSILLVAVNRYSLCLSPVKSDLVTSDGVSLLLKSHLVVAIVRFVARLSIRHFLLSHHHDYWLTLSLSFNHR